MTAVLHFVVFLVCALALGVWWGLRWSEATRKVNRSIAELVMAVDIERAQRAADDEADR